MSQHVYVVSEWLAKEGYDHQLWKVFQELMSLTLKNEAGCIRANATRQVAHPGSPSQSKFKIILLQEYINVQAFDLHCASDYVKNVFHQYVEDKQTAIVKEWKCRLFSESVY